MAAISDFLPYVLPYVTGCSELLAEQMIRDVCIDFCTKSLVVQQRIPAITSTVGEYEYEFEELSGELRVHMVMQAWYDGNELDVRGMDAVTPEPVDGLPTALFQIDNTSFQLNRKPEVAGSIEIRAAVAPLRTATEVPDVLLNDYAYEIGQGAIARLLRIPKQVFTDVQSSLLNEKEYEKARNAAQLKANKAFGRTDDRVRPRRI